ncbi:proto-oncogene c-Fos-like isoform X1 [Pomacea canaliculata]|uniref:proto-oncogene c-Fos-like isoform X1 n=1 Tax=Pomacea canaliculata TaxID=400727 RepID=UPI000D7345E6|nr:proto-oncogene c-Fos-like isoform X1 [Pomacea canaliculata]
MESEYSMDLESFSAGCAEKLFESHFATACSTFSAAGSESLDTELAEAARMAYESGTITPLVKQELRLVIQTRRLSQGKDELRVAFSAPCSHQLTPAEEAQRMRRKEQNRRAARRFRQNRKLRESVLEEEISNLEVKNAGLRDKIKELQQLKDLLLQHVTAHFIKHHLPDSPQSGVGHPPRGLPDAMLRLPRCLPAFDKPETH